MGTLYSKIYYEGTIPAYLPEKDSSPTFDAQFGFKGPRIPRESKVSLQEARAARLTAKEYDYCAHLLLDYYMCFQQKFPLYGLCSEESEAHKHCEIEDYILRMKEFEREKRLRLRELKKQGKNVQ